jgi:hypothetical protein
MLRISSADFSRVIGEELADVAKKFVEDSNFEFEELSKDETAIIAKKISDEINGNLPVSGKGRKNDWEKGWSENEDKLSETDELSSLIPRYFGKYQIVRWDGKLIKAISSGFEYKMLQAIELHEFQKYLPKFERVIELGCGTGHNLFRARSVNDSAELIGLDWATSSQSILSKLNESGKLSCCGYNFDFFAPASDLSFKESAVYSISALEQIGNSHEKLIQFLIDKAPAVCLHLEPLVELMDEENSTLDKLCADYCRKRNYLSNFLNRLRDLEKEGVIEILEVRRNYIGSLYIEGYSLVAWRPIRRN